MIYTLPEVEDVELLHEVVLVISTGRPGIHNKGLIESAVKRPEKYLQYVDDYDIDTICALLIEAIARHHGFNDGNKRTALLTAIYTYRLNGVHFTTSEDMNKDFDALVMWVVTQKPPIEKICERLKELRLAHGGKEQAWRAILTAFSNTKAFRR
jgi:death-on-curing protein